MKIYVKGNNDYYMGYDANGNEIDESTVDALRQVVTYEILPYSELAELGNVYLSEDSFKYTATGTAFGAYMQYTLILSTDDDEIDVYSFQRNHNEMMLDFSRDRNYVMFHFNINVNGDKINVTAEDIDVYEDGTYSDYYSEKFSKTFDVPGICNMIAEMAEPVVREIQVKLSNI